MHPEDNKRKIRSGPKDREKTKRIERGSGARAKTRPQQEKVLATELSHQVQKRRKEIKELEDHVEPEEKNRKT